MTIQECYIQFGGDYQGTLTRLMKEDIIEEYLRRFPKSTDVSVLEDELNQKHYASAYRCAHKLKGVALNLGLTRLDRACDVLCEEIHYEDPQQEPSKLLDEVREAYTEICDAIRQLDTDEA